MSEAALLLLLWMFQVGPNDYQLKYWLASADEIEQTLLPLDELQAHWQPMWLVAHRRPDWPPVFYVEPRTAVGDAGALLFGARRSLPGRQVPRLFIAASFWRDGTMERGLRPLDGMALDDVEKVFRGYLDVFVKRKMAAYPDLSAHLQARADVLMVEAPADQRRGVLRGALVDFGAHMLSIAHEVGRHSRRKSTAKLCAVLDHPATLFGFWRGAMEEAEFKGWIRAGKPSGDDRRRPWRQSRAALSIDDKRWFLREILGAPWVGDPRLDFAALCGT